jgi:NADPH:quinone reductase-like Zn-dependent oxidoreductase
MPANLTFEESATLGVAGLTSAMSLWKWLHIPLPPTASAAQDSPSSIDSVDERYLLVWGGAATTGQYAIQIARLGGIKTICVASTSSSPLCLALGASHVVTRDGKTPEEIVVEIRAIVGDSITMAIDLVGTKTAEYCLKAVSQQRDVLFAPLAMISKDAKIPTNVTVQTVEMKRFVLDSENAVYAQKLNELVESGQIKVPALEVVGSGLAMVEAGLERVKNGNRSGKKLVVTIP